MPDYELVQLANGVWSVRSLAESETFHPVVGPVQEARTLYVEQTRLPERIERANREFVIWDVGLGAAANVLTVLDAVPKQSRKKIRILSFDHTLKPLEFAIEHAGKLDYPKLFLPELSALARERTVEFRRDALKVKWNVFVADFPMLLASSDAWSWPKPDAILFDAFSPAKNPAMWTLSLFTRLFELLDPARPCAMPTYSRSTMLRVTLLLAGFYVGVGKAIAEKEETTIAANDLSLIESPLNENWLRRARNSTCAEPLREPAYTRAPLSEQTFAALKRLPQFRS